MISLYIFLFKKLQTFFFLRNTIKAYMKKAQQNSGTVSETNKVMQ